MVRWLGGVVGVTAVDFNRSSLSLALPQKGTNQTLLECVSVLALSIFGEEVQFTRNKRRVGYIVKDDEGRLVLFGGREI